jgi:FkbM family methyltransferase
MATFDPQRGAMKGIGERIWLILLGGWLFIGFVYCRSNWLTERYGPKLYSKHDEELIIRDFFRDKRGGYFVDVGAGHYRVNSNTYYLEKNLDWQGLAVDANCDYAKDYPVFRPMTRFFCFFVAAKSGLSVDFYIPFWNKRLATGDSVLAERQGLDPKTKVKSITLDDLLNGAGVARFDFLSIDIELGEPAALSGFDIEKYRPALVCIEAHDEVREQVLDYFLQHNYMLARAYDGLDPLNMYFIPKR